ncbi:MAG: FIST C-terminal domain-containing protein [Flavobacteriales bacterium]|nr:FIST C-terminal domain-containing protein [Flavobacteriales bacterium]
MKIDQLTWSSSGKWDGARKTDAQSVQLILGFGDVDMLANEQIYSSLKEDYANALVVLVSTAGEICHDQVNDQTVVANALQFEKTTIEHVQINISDYDNSEEAGETLASKLPHEGLKHVLIVSDGISVNGDELAKGLNNKLDPSVLVTGGLAADGGRFTQTRVGAVTAPQSGAVVAVGFYGEDLIVGHGSMGGWDSFGPVRTITRSEGNKLYELDNKNALEVYKKYLGDKASELPASALLFPLSIFNEDSDKELVRTILSIDEDEGSMTFAGDIPQDNKARFMMANFDRLVEGAGNAAQSANAMSDGDPEFVLMISCVGRKLVLGQRIEDEVEAVIELLGDDAVYSGFYSNGELSPFKEKSECSLHNQTMTITTYKEAV